MRFLIAVMLVCSPALADPPSDDARWRWEAAVGGTFGTIKLRHQDIGGGGLILQGGMRNHRFAVMADYRDIGVHWTADGNAARGQVPPVDTDGNLHRFALSARWNVLSLGATTEPLMHEFCEVFALAGVGAQLIEWDQGGALWRPDLELGGGVRMYGIRINDRRTVGVLFRLAEVMTRRPAGYDTSPTCVGPCDVATSPTGWEKGLVASVALVVTN